VIDWPSTENEFDAWSPSPWNSPLESAATPGVVDVTRELSDDDSLSMGTLMNMSRSTSVWNVGSVSTRSPWASTVTVESAAATCITSFTVKPTTVFRFTAWRIDPKPLAETANW